MADQYDGEHPAALVQNRVETLSPPRYWTGGAKPIWAAVLSMLFGVVPLAAVVAGLGKYLSIMPVWGYLYVFVVLLVSACYEAGAILLLFRRRLGKYLVVTAVGVTAVFFFVTDIVYSSLHTDLKPMLYTYALFALIAGLALSKSTSAWLAAER